MYTIFFLFFINYLFRVCFFTCLPSVFCRLYPPNNGMWVPSQNDLADLGMKNPYNGHCCMGTVRFTLIKYASKCPTKGTPVGIISSFNPSGISMGTMWAYQELLTHMGILRGSPGANQLHLAHMGFLRV